MELDDASGFSARSRAFKDDPTIENYLRLRRESPDEIIEVAITPGIEWLFGNVAELEKHDIPPDLIAKVLDANQAAISTLCLLLMERLVARRKMEKNGKTHLASRGEAISDSFVNFLINMMLDSLDWNDELEISRDLIVLIRHQIRGEQSEWDRKEETRRNRSNAVHAALQLASSGTPPSYRKIAALMGVDATTVMRWFPNGELTDAIRRLVEVHDIGEEIIKRK